MATGMSTGTTNVLETVDDNYGNVDGKKGGGEKGLRGKREDFVESLSDAQRGQLQGVIKMIWDVLDSKQGSASPQPSSGEIQAPTGQTDKKDTTTILPIEDIQLTEEDIPDKYKLTQEDKSVLEKKQGDDKKYLQLERKQKMYQNFLNFLRAVNNLEESRFWEYIKKTDNISNPINKQDMERGEKYYQKCVEKYGDLPTDITPLFSKKMQEITNLILRKTTEQIAWKNQQIEQQKSKYQMKVAGINRKYQDQIEKISQNLSEEEKQEKENTIRQERDEKITQETKNYNIECYYKESSVKYIKNIIHLGDILRCNRRYTDKKLFGQINKDLSRYNNIMRQREEELKNKITTYIQEDIDRYYDWAICQKYPKPRLSWLRPKAKRAREKQIEDEKQSLKQSNLSEQIVNYIVSSQNDYTDENINNILRKFHNQKFYIDFDNKKGESGAEQATRKLNGLGWLEHPYDQKPRVPSKSDEQNLLEMAVK